MNKIDRVNDTINQFKNSLDAEKLKPVKNDILIQVLTNRIKIFEDRKKRLVELQKVEKEVFESQQKRKRGRKRVK